MNLKQQKLVIGCLLHDFGKLLHRYNESKKNHSTSGYEYLKELKQLENEEDILNCVLYHHRKFIEKAEINDDAICYITYIADNISVGADRREKEIEGGTPIHDVALESIFNVLNNNNEKMMYSPNTLSESLDINYPTDKKIVFDENFYYNIVNDVSKLLKSVQFNNEYINSILQMLEYNITLVPSSTHTGELVDISLYDHVKTTAAIALCIEQYLEENNITNYKKSLFTNATKFYNEKAFRMYSMNIVGIQEFTYNISSKSALKGLRARSFYVEILMEDIVDELLSRLNLCRTNVLYVGGGSTYMLLPATTKASEIIKEFEKELNKWFIETFDVSVYAASGYVDCCANDLKNCSDGSYKQVVENVNRAVLLNKINKYTADEILSINKEKNCDYSRECVICHRSEILDANNECAMCSGLKKLSDMVIGENDNFFVVLNAESDEKNVSLPFGQCITAYPLSEMENIIKNNTNYVRLYSKNKGYVGFNVMSNLYVSDYAAQKEFSKLAEDAEGIKRIAVIRADIDDLEQAFLSGFSEEYKTISRVSTLSRKLSMFFKLHMNSILKNGQFQLFENKNKTERNAAVVYSGGDDLFVVGGWDDIVCFAVDLYNCFKKFTQGTLTISAGIGIYPEKFPISEMAEQTGHLLEISKKHNNGKKDAVTLFDETECYSWNEFIESVIGEKLRTLQSYSKVCKLSKALLYKMLELIRNKEKENKLNIARFAYTIARLKPDEKSKKEIEKYNEFAIKMYRWIQNEKDVKQLITAIYIYVYMNRERS